MLVIAEFVGMYCGGVGTTRSLKKKRKWAVTL